MLSTELVITYITNLGSFVKSSLRCQLNMMRQKIMGNLIMFCINKWRIYLLYTVFNMLRKCPQMAHYAHFLIFYHLGSAFSTLLVTNKGSEMNISTGFVSQLTHALLHF